MHITLALYNYHKIKSRLIFIFDNERGRALWIGGNLHLHGVLCVLLFLIALTMLAYQLAVLYCFILTLLYIAYLWSNRSLAILLKQQYSTVPNHDKKIRYFALLELMTSGARKENIPALCGYVLLFLCAIAFYVWDHHAGRNSAFLEIMSAFVAGAATLHFAISVITFGDLMAFSETEQIEPWAQFLTKIELDDPQVAQVAAWHHAEADTVSTEVLALTRFAWLAVLLPLLSVWIFLGLPT